MQDIRFVHDPQTKRRKPFAFVVFKHEESVQYAIKIFRDVKLFGRHIQMQHRSKPRTDVDRQRTISAPPQVFRPPAPVQQFTTSQPSQCYNFARGSAVLN